MTLYPFQQKTVFDIDNAFKRTRHVFLAYYTGAGKTNIFLELCRKKIAENPKVKIGISSYITTEIRDQTFFRTKELGLKSVFVHGLGEESVDSNIEVFNPQAIYKKEIETVFDYFIIDEGHVALGEDCKMLNMIMKRTTNKKTKFIIATATPWDVLRQKRFKNAVVLKRSFDDGLNDGLLSDIKIIIEQNKLKFRPRDFTRQGDLSSKHRMKMSVLKSACFGKLDYIIQTYKEMLGNKVLVICPAGNTSEVAREAAIRYRGLAYIERSFNAEWDFEDNLQKFKTEDDIQFLFVTYKCTIGFDMKELTSVIDLSMTRNVKTLVQRMGRVARKHKDLHKNYFYVADKSITNYEIQWLLHTVFDVSLGNYENLVSRDIKFKPQKIRNRVAHDTSAKTIIDLIRLAANEKNYKDFIDVTLCKTKQPKRRSLKSALKDALHYSSRTEMWSQNPALYKWFRLYALDDMNKVFPYKKRVQTESEDAIREKLKAFKSRSEVRTKDRRLYYYAQEKYLHLFDELFGKPKYDGKFKWSEESAKKVIENIDSWGEIRTEYAGLRSWLNLNKKNKEMKDYFNKIKRGRRNENMEAQKTR